MKSILRKFTGAVLSVALVMGAMGCASDGDSDSL